MSTFTRHSLCVCYKILNKKNTHIQHTCECTGGWSIKNCRILLMFGHKTGVSGPIMPFDAAAFVFFSFAVNWL